MKYSKFNRLFVFFTIPSILIVGILNFVVNPYGVFQGFQVSKINELKPKQKDHARLFKTYDIINFKPQTIFLGTSRTEIGFNVNNPILQEYEPVYNLALPGSNIYESMTYFQHAIINQPNLKRVIIGIDFRSFQNSETLGQEDFSEERLGKTGYLKNDLINVIFSVDALESSVKTIAANLNPNYAKRFNFIYLTKGQLSLLNPDNQSQKKLFENQIKGYFTRGIYSPNSYQMPNQSLENIRRIIELAKINDIEIFIFISPAHVLQWEGLRAAELWSSFEQWKREIVKIIPVWDFSGYNSITTEAINDDMKYFLDSSHYYPVVGDLILHRLLLNKTQDVPTDFGILINSDNIESHLLQIREDREKWAKNNHDLVQSVQKWYDNTQ